MAAGIRTGQWMLPVFVVLIVLVLLGGYLIDMLGLNLDAVQSMNGRTTLGENPETGKMLTAWGDCRQAHLIGRDYLLQGQYELALPSLQAGADCTNDPWAWYDLGQAQFAVGDLENASISWQHSPQGYIQAVKYASSTSAAEDFEAALAAWQFAADVNPYEQAPYIQLSHLRAGTDPEQVEPLLLQAIEANPDGPAAYIELGNFYLNKGEKIEAQLQFEKALALDPSNINLLMAMAYNAADIGNTPAAIEYWQEVAFRNDRRKGLAYYQIGNLAFTDSNFSSALAFFKRAVELEPENNQYLLGLAGAYVEVGCRQLALAAYQQVVERATNAAVKAEAELKLSEIAVINDSLTPCPEEQ